MIPLIGPQNDEVLFASGILQPKYIEATSHRNPDIPFMLMPYIGALKIYLYKAVFWVAAPDLWSLRVPVLLMGALSIWLTFLIGKRFIPAEFAALAAALLAVDPIFLLTGVFDWGPVALQHLLVLLMVLAAMRAHENGRWSCAVGAGLCCGLGVWDKVSFLWLLVGLLAAVALAWPGGFVRSWSKPKLWAPALAAAAAGATLFLRYNLRSDWGTFRASRGLDLESLGSKLLALQFSFDGRALLGFLVENAGMPDLPRGSWQGYALIAALLAIPFLGVYRRKALALTAALVVSFIAMSAMRNAGGSAHHTVLMWPLPQLIIATGAAGLAARGRIPERATWVCAAAVVISSLSITLLYIQRAQTAGPAGQWTLASKDLVRSLERRKPQDIFVVDWGILCPLRFLGAGRLPILPASDSVAAEVERSAGDPRLEKLKLPSTLVVTHPQSKMLFTDLNVRLDNWAGTQGLVKTVLEEVRDEHGVIQFEIYRYTAKPQ